MNCSFNNTSASSSNHNETIKTELKKVLLFNDITVIVCEYLNLSDHISKNQSHEYIYNNKNKYKDFKYNYYKNFKSSSFSFENFKFNSNFQNSSRREAYVKETIAEEPNWKIGDVEINKEKFKLPSLSSAPSEEKEALLLNGKTKIEDCDLCSIFLNRIYLGKRDEALFRMPGTFKSEESEKRRSKLFYNALALQLHPDKLGQDKSEVFKVLTNAWEAYKAIL